MKSNPLVVIRIGGNVNLKKTIGDTFKMLKLYSKHYCIVVPANPHYVGMIKKVQDYVTWGEITQETLLQLVRTRGRLAAKKILTDDIVHSQLNTDLEGFCKEVFAEKKSFKDLAGMKTFFRLSPPKGGYERLGTKHPFSMGGALGYRKDKINALVMRML